MRTERTAIPKALRAAVFLRAEGRCEGVIDGVRCNARLTGIWHCDHIIAHYVVREHRIENLRALCEPCHKPKTKADAKVIAKIKRLRGETGPQARRAAGKNRPIPSPGFRKGGPKKVWPKRPMSRKPKPKDGA